MDLGMAMMQTHPDTQHSQTSQSHNTSNNKLHDATNHVSTQPTHMQTHHQRPGPTSATPSSNCSYYSNEDSDDAMDTIDFHCPYISCHQRFQAMRSHGFSHVHTHSLAHSPPQSLLPAHKPPLTDDIDTHNTAASSPSSSSSPPLPALHHDSPSPPPPPRFACPHVGCAHVSVDRREWAHHVLAESHHDLLPIASVVRGTRAAVVG